MARYQQSTHSPWQDIKRLELPTMQANLDADVCIIGAGISGLTTAYLLLQMGFHVVVLEKEAFGQNETGLSTAHISTALDEGYALLRKWHGAEGSRLAYESHSEAISLIEKIIAEERISCDFLRTEGFLFLDSEHDQSFLENEMTAAHAAGFSEVTLLNKAPVTFFNSGPCLHFPRQAQFDPLKYLKGLTEAIRKLGGEIYTQTRAIEVKGGPRAYVKTSQGLYFSCQHVVVATNVPINDRVTMHTKEAAYRTYAIGIRIPKGHMPPSLFWDTAVPYHFVRMSSLTNQDFDILIVGGEDHRVGQCDHPEKQYLKLKEWTQQRLGILPNIRYRWSGQIIEPLDGLAYIGRNPGDDENIYIVSGDSGHGITHGTIAGMILRDLIAGHENKYTALYSPSRFNWKCLSRYARENFKGAIHYTDWIPVDSEKITREELAPGEGAVITEGLHKIAVYRDEIEASLHECSAMCPHLKGVVRWNSMEKTWDCPLHGSRFSKMGEVLNGPAAVGLTPREVPKYKTPPKPPKDDGLEKLF